MEYNYKYCRRCNKLYTYSGSLYCKHCLDELERYVSRIREFLYDHPDTNIIEICEELEISEKDILHLIKENRIELKNTKLEDLGLVCASCGKPVLDGKYCKECKEKLLSKMINASNDMKAKIHNNDVNKTTGVMNTLHGKK